MTEMCIVKGRLRDLAHAVFYKPYFHHQKPIEEVRQAYSDLSEGEDKDYCCNYAELLKILKKEGFEREQIIVSTDDYFTIIYIREAIETKFLEK